MNPALPPPPRPGAAAPLPAPRLSVITLCIALFLATLPLVGKMAAWALALFLVCLIARAWIEYSGRRLITAPIKIALVVFGITGVLVTYQTLVGSEPGLSILLILIGIKMLETVSVRDFQIAAILVCVLCLSDLFFSQDLPQCVYAGVVAMLAVIALVHLHSGVPAPGKLKKSARTAFLLLVQALPIVLILFLFFPRFYGRFSLRMNPELFAGMGMSDHLAPGAVSSLATSNAIAFRAKFPDGLPNLPAMYWRGAVLWRGNGLNWVLSPSEELPALPTHQRKWIRQEIVIEPHGGNWLFALDRPALRVRGAILREGDYLQNDQRIFTPYRYDVLSEIEPANLPLSTRFRALTTQWQPQSIGPASEALAKSWKASSQSDQEIVEKALDFFRKEHFVYSLAPGEYHSESLDEFLFQRKKGFCEHYAASFASLMRVAGIPSRVVLGYLGGQYNRLGDYIIVRQSDSHAWCEVWLAGRGWIRVDPTTVVAPERISSGLDSYLNNSVVAGESDRSVFGNSPGSLGLRTLISDIRLICDSINYQWNLRVLDFDEESQHDFLSAIGLPALRGSRLLIWTLSLALAAVGLICLYVTRGASAPVDKVRKAYDRFCRRLARLGVPRNPAEGPVRFAERAAWLIPDRTEAIRQISDLYIDLRYARGGFDPQKLKILQRRIREF